MALIDNIGELDACISIASFRELLALWCKTGKTCCGHMKWRKLEAYSDMWIDYIEKVRIK